MFAGKWRSQVCARHLDLMSCKSEAVLTKTLVDTRLFVKLGVEGYVVLGCSANLII
jgi:hypothetical protein